CQRVRVARSAASKLFTAAEQQHPSTGESGQNDGGRFGDGRDGDVVQVVKLGQEQWSHTGRVHGDDDLVHQRGRVRVRDGDETGRKQVRTAIKGVFNGGVQEALDFIARAIAGKVNAVEKKTGQAAIGDLDCGGAGHPR